MDDSFSDVHTTQEKSNACNILKRDNQNSEIKRTRKKFGIVSRDHHVANIFTSSVICQ